jgi:hypothetical protein
MERIIRKVADIDSADRRAIEHLIGDRLAEHQQIIISVVNLDLASPVESDTSASAGVPEWWNMYEGLSDEEVDRLDQAIRQRADLTRSLG